MNKGTVKIPSGNNEEAKAYSSSLVTDFDGDLMGSSYAGNTPKSQIQQVPKAALPPIQERIDDFNNEVNQRE